MKITKSGRYTGLVSNATSSSSSAYDNSGGLLPPGTDTVQEAIDAFLGGLAGTYLTTILGGQGVVEPLGTLGATELIDLNNANKFWGTLDQDCTITTTGWTPLKDVQISVELIQDGTGGWTPTFSGVTWIGGTPTWDTAAGTVTHVVLFSRDGGTTIYGAVVGGGGGADHSLVTVAASGAAQTIDVSVATTYDITLTANCTFTLTGAVSGEAWLARVILRQGGSGSYTATWPGSVDWQDPTDGTGGGAAPTLWTVVGAQNVIELATLDGGTSWGGRDTLAGSSGGTPAITVTDETTFGITPAVGTDTEYARQDHTHGTPDDAELQVAGHYELLMAAGITSPPEPMENGDGSDWLYVWIPG